MSGFGGRFIRKFGLASLMGFGTLLEDEVRKIVEEKNERDEDEAAIVKRNFW